MKTRQVGSRTVNIQKNTFDLADQICNTSSFTLPHDFNEFTNLIGKPQHPATRQSMELTPYQKEIQSLVRKHRSAKYIVNKSRQLGLTEIILRIIQYEALVGKYIGKKIGIIAGTNADLAKKNLKRLYDLFEKIPYTVRDYRGHILVLTNGTIIEAFRANEEALTGDTKYACIFIDESAKWRLRDDSAVFNSILPIVQTNKADLFLISTPKGPVKKFYEIWNSENDFIKLKYDIYSAQGNMYTAEEIQELLTNSVEDINQEYLCEFTIGRNSVFSDYSLEQDHEEILL